MRPTFIFHAAAKQSVFPGTLLNMSLEATSLVLTVEIKRFYRIDSHLRYVLLPAHEAP